MTYRVSFIIMIVTVAGCIAASEAAYRLIEGNTIATGAALAKIGYIKSLKNDGSKVLLITSSITAPILSDNIFKFHETLGLGLVGAVTLNGYSKIINQIASINSKLKNVYVFITPMRIGSFPTPDDRRTYNYYYKQFQTIPEIISNAKSKPEVVKIIIEDRVLFLEHLLNYKNYSTSKWREEWDRFLSYTYSKPLHVKHTKPPPKHIASLEVYYKELGPHTNYQIKTLGQVAHRHNLDITFVVPPLRQKSYNNWKKTEVRFIDLCRTNNINYKNVNDIYRFPENAFKDSLHLKPSWAPIYLSLIQKQLNILKRIRTNGEK